VAFPVGGPEKYEKPASRTATLGGLTLNPSDRVPVPGFRVQAGSYGRVLKSRHIRTGEISAVKEIIP
jgi:hypothetical protein